MAEILYSPTAKSEMLLVNNPVLGISAFSVPLGEIICSVPVVPFVIVIWRFKTLPSLISPTSIDNVGFAFEILNAFVVWQFR